MIKIKKRKVTQTAIQHGFPITEITKLTSENNTNTRKITLMMKPEYQWINNQTFFKSMKNYS
jgi:hypothetical protein